MGNRTAEEVGEYLSRHGYAFEHATARAFRMAGFRPTIGRPYRDPLLPDKIREVDVWAVSAFRSALVVNGQSQVDVATFLAIECKAQTANAWIARVSPVPRPRDARWRPIASPSMTTEIDRLSLMVTGRMGIGDPVPFTVLEATEDRSGRASNPAYDAINQAISGAVALAAELSGACVVLPVVALKSTPLFTVQYDGDDPTITPVQRVRVLWSGSVLQPSPTAVDLISTHGELTLEQLAHQLRADLQDYYLEAAPGWDRGPS